MKSIKKNMEMKQVKPILTIGIPNLMEDEVKEDYMNLKSMIKDYHVIIYDTTSDDVRFEVFYEKDITETTIEELRSLVIEGFKKERK